MKYWEVLEIGFEGIMAKAQAELDGCNVGDGDYARKSHFLEAVLLSCQAVIGLCCTLCKTCAGDG